MNNPPSNPCFSAAQLAAALARDPRSIRQALALIPGDSVSFINGQEAAAWHYDSLPPSLCADLAAVARRQFYRDALHMLASPAEQWQPPVPLESVKPEALAKATKLRAALATPLQHADDPTQKAHRGPFGDGWLATPLQHAADPTVTRAARQQTGLAEYQKAFGHPISVKHWWRLFDRTIARDRGQHEVARVELYLDDNIGQAAPGARIHPSLLSFKSLAETVKQFENQEKPTADDKAHFWHAAFESFEELLAEHPERRAQRLIKNSLLDWMYKAAPSLAKNQKSLRRVFEIKLKLWRAGERCIDALEDLRPIYSGNHAPFDFTEDKKKLRNRAVMLDGNESLAFRQLYNAREFSQTFMDRHKFEPRVNKSNVPDSVRADVTCQVEAMLPYHHGPRAAKLAGPSIMRNYDNVAPGDWFSADDWTPEIYFWLNDQNGQPHIMRGECLLFIDVRSRYPLKFLLIAGHYNSEHIRSAILQTHDVHGLPHNGFQFENGVWRGLVEGIGQGALGFRETERGLAAPGIGLRIRRTYLPRGKVIEGIFNVLQNSQRNLPGYCGPNEQVQKMERLQKFLAQARAGKVHPGNELFEMSEWRKMIDKACQEYATEPQNGRMLPGISPAECWAQRQPLRKLPDEGRYILASHKIQTTVRPDGIWITVRGKRRNYYSEHTGPRIGRTILAFYNVEQPDLLTCCDLDKTNFFTAMHRELPAFAATKEQFAAVNADRTAHMRHVRTEYDQMAHTERISIVRDNSIDDADRVLGQQHNAAVADHRTAVAESTRKLRKISRDSAALGLAVPRNVKNPDRVQKGTDLVADGLARLEARENQKAENL